MCRERQPIFITQLQLALLDEMSFKIISCSSLGVIFTFNEREKSARYKGSCNSQVKAVLWHALPFIYQHTAAHLLGLFQ